MTCNSSVYMYSLLQMQKPQTVLSHHLIIPEFLFLLIIEFILYLHLAITVSDTCSHIHTHVYI